MTAPRLSPRTVAALVLALGCAASLAVNWPGHMSYDSILQLWQGRTGVFNTWHPPVMAWMLGLADAVVRGPALFVLFDTLLLYGGLMALLFLPGEASWRTVAVALAWAVLPDGLVYPAIVWKDVLFAAAMLAGFAALAQAAANWKRPRLRTLLAALAVGFWSLAALARQNGAVALPLGALALGVVAWREGGRRPIRPGLVFGLAALCAGAAVVAGATLALDARADGEPARLYQVEDLQTYDLVAAVKADAGLRLDRLQAANPAVVRLIRTEGVKAYTPVRIDPLIALGDLQDQLHDTPPRALAAQWRELILRHPLLYLKVRATAFASVFLTPDIDECVPVFTGVSGPEPYMRRLGLVERGDDRDVLLRAYGAKLTPTPVFSHALYAAIALAAFVLLLRRGRAEDIATAGLMAAALAFAATFALISIACDYRYLYALDVAAVAGLLRLTAGGGCAARR